MSASVMQGALVMMTQLRFLHLTVRLACSIVFLVPPLADVQLSLYRCI